MYCIDGHNLLGAMGRDGSNVNIEFLIQYLATYSQRKRMPIAVVFDNTTNLSSLTSYEKRNSLEIYFSDPSIDANADDRIVRLFMRKNTNGVTVVTADRDLRDRLTIIGIKNFLKPDEFIAMVEKPVFAGNPQELTKDEELAAAGINEKELYNELLEAFKKPE